MAVRERSWRVGRVKARVGTWGLLDWRVWHVSERDDAWRRVAARGARVREAENSGGAWGRVWCVFWSFLVGFCSELSVLSLNAFAFTVG